MQQSLFVEEFQTISPSQIREVEAAERTITELEKKGHTIGLRINEVEIFLRALAVSRRYPSWAK
jgi:hypothetical protein